MAETTKKIINDMLWNTDRFRNECDETEWAILIHASIIDKVRNRWHKLFKNDDWKAVDYTLQIGSKCYEMFLIVVRTGNNSIFSLWSAIDNSQFSFPWEEKPTLFISVESYHVMEEFIRIYNLQAYILKIEDKPAITWNDGIIRVITFKKRIKKKLNIMKKYEHHLASTESNHGPKYFYMAHAFEWQQPYKLKHFKIPIPDECYSVFPIILNHFRTLNYTNELNIFDLLSIRLALFDDRNPLPSHLLKFDIDSMIKRELAKIVRNNHLNLDQYLLAKNNEKNDFLIDYLVYEFQHLFETVELQKGSVIGIPVGSHTIDRKIKLVDEGDVLTILKHTSNIKFEIDGSSYDRMSLSLFLDLIECHNVVKITLDTNYRWINNECNLNRNISDYQIIYVGLRGTNIYNFIEEFIRSLKTVIFPKRLFGGIYLNIKGNINDYTIFDNLTVSDIELNRVKINTHMLQDLLKCNLKSIIFIVDCTFENTPQNWALLHNLGKLIDYMTIREDEGTWLSLFEFIVDEMRKTNSKKFKFGHESVDILSDDHTIISLCEFKFRFDELKTKLEIRDRNNNKIIDLFEKKFNLKPDKKSKYDFYQ